MADNETPVISSMLMDRSEPFGNSIDIDTRRALHTKIKNTPQEPINVSIVESPPTSPETSINVFSQALSVPPGVQTALITYTVPALKTLYLEEISMGGENVAKYQLFFNGTLSGIRRTMFGGNLNESFIFTRDLKRGLKFNSGDTINVQVTHTRPDSADFESNILGVLIG